MSDSSDGLSDFDDDIDSIVTIDKKQRPPRGVTLDGSKDGYLRQLIKKAILVEENEIKGKILSVYFVPDNEHDTPYQDPPIVSMPQLDEFFVETVVENAVIRYQRYELEKEQNNALIQISHRFSMEKADNFIYSWSPTTPLVCFKDDEYRIEKDLKSKFVRLLVAKKARINPTNVSIVGLSVKLFTNSKYDDPPLSQPIINGDEMIE